MLLLAFAMSAGATTSTKVTPPIHEANRQAAIANDSGYIAEANVDFDRKQADSPFRIVLYAQLILRALLLLAAVLFIGSALVFAIRDRKHPSTTAPESPGTIRLRASPLLEV
jgi:hypothetical protein